MVRRQAWWVVLLCAMGPACARQVAGRVVDELRSPVSGAEVVAYAAPGQVVARAVSSNGQFMLAVDDGVAKFVAIARQPKGDLVGAATWDTVGDDIVVVVGPTVTVTGEVVDSQGVPVRGASVAVAELRPRIDGAPACVVDEPTRCGFPQLRGSTDAAGRYAFSGVPRGWVGTTRVYVDGSTPLVTSPLAGRWQFSPATITTVPRRESSARGTPVWQGRVLRDGGYRPVERARVELLDESGEVLGTAVSDAAGDFSFEAVPAGTSAVAVLPPPDSLIAPEVGAPPKPKGAGEYAPVYCALRPAARVSGRVVEQGTRRAWPGVWVVCVPVLAAQDPVFRVLRQEVETAADGTFHLNCSPYLAEIGVERGDEVVARQRLDLAPGRATEGLVLEVPGPRTLHVQLRRPTGQPVVRQRIVWRDGLSELQDKVLVTDADGGADLPGSPRSWRQLGFLLESEMLYAMRVVESEDGGHPVAVDLQAPPRCVVRGRVLAPDRHAVAGAVILLEALGERTDQLPDPRVPVHVARSGPDGRFSADGLFAPAGSTLTVSAAGYRPGRVVGDAAIDGVCDIGDMTLLPAARTVTGNVLGTGAWVFAEGMVGPQPTATGPMGEFALPELPDETVRLLATDAAGRTVGSAEVAPGGQLAKPLPLAAWQPDWQGAPTAADRALSAELLREAMRDTLAAIPEVARLVREQGAMRRLTGDVALDAAAAAVGETARWLSTVDPDAAVAAIRELPPGRQHSALLGWLRPQPYGVSLPAELDRVVAAIPGDDAREMAAARLAAALPAAEWARARDLAQTALHGAGGVPPRLHRSPWQALARLGLLARTGLATDVLNAELARLLEHKDASEQMALVERLWLSGVDLRLASGLRDALTAPEAREQFTAAWVRDQADLDPAAALGLAQSEWLSPGAKAANRRLNPARAAALSHLAVRLLPTQPAVSRTLVEQLPDVPWPCDERARWALAHATPQDVTSAVRLLLEHRSEGSDVADLPLPATLEAGGELDRRLRARLLRAPLPTLREEPPRLLDPVRQSDADLAYALSAALPGRSRWLIEQLLLPVRRPDAEEPLLALVAHDPKRAVRLCRALPEAYQRVAPMIALAIWFGADERGRRLWLPSRPVPAPRASAIGLDFMLWIPETGPDGQLPNPIDGAPRLGARPSGYSFEWPAS